MNCENENGTTDPKSKKNTYLQGTVKRNHPSPTKLPRHHLKPSTETRDGMAPLREEWSLGVGLCNL